MQVDGNFFPVCFPDGRLGGARVVPTRSGWRPVDAGNLPGGSFVRTRCGLGQAALRPKRWRGARGLAMTEIKLWRTPHSAFSIPHLNGSFPVFSLEWTIGGNGVESMQLESCLAHSWSFLRHVGKPNAVQANQSLMHYENQT
jgi:hypothetical protein